jgi:hypothetical protein
MSLLGHDRFDSSSSLVLIKHLVKVRKNIGYGKMRFSFTFDLTAAQIEEMKDERTIKQLDGKTPNKVIIVQENN